MIVWHPGLTPPLAAAVVRHVPFPAARSDPYPNTDAFVKYCKWYFNCVASCYMGHVSHIVTWVSRTVRLATVRLCQYGTVRYCKQIMCSTSDVVHLHGQTHPTCCVASRNGWLTEPQPHCGASGAFRVVHHTIKKFGSVRHKWATVWPMVLHVGPDWPTPRCIALHNRSHASQCHRVPLSGLMIVHN